VISVFLIPVMMQAVWVKNFLTALFGGTDAIKAFSKPSHKFDTPKPKKAD